MVEDEARLRKMIVVALRRAGYDVTEAGDGEAALAALGESLPDLIISDIMMPGVDGLALLGRLRENPATSAVPLILLTARASVDDIVGGLHLGADDYLTKPFQMPELLARVRAKIERPSVPAELLPRDRQSGLMSERLLLQEAARELERAGRGRATGCLAVLQFEELEAIVARFGTRGERAAIRQAAELVTQWLPSLALAGSGGPGELLVLLPEMSAEDARAASNALAERIARHRFSVGSEGLRLTPSVGLASFERGMTAELLRHRATVAREHAAMHLDLQTRTWEPRYEDEAIAREAARRAAAASRRRTLWKERARIPFQIALTVVAGLVVPFFLYMGAWRAGVDVSNAMYLFVTASLLVTAALIWVEGFLASRRIDPPEQPGEPYPPASAIIAAYMPNEAATIVETVESFLRVDYPGPLQVILAYNTPRDLPVEAELQEISRRDPRFISMRVPQSTSKAQNVNAALARITGQFLGVFDADHHPQEDSFTRAWRWLSNGYDVVQGHCVIRNGDASWVAKMTAVEFEAIYAVAHPGRSRLHGFGIFGGSNGYWRTEWLREIRFHGDMLTEDIDSSMRVVENGGRIRSDPYLISRELAPAQLSALWNQRLRWAQGWFQVSLKHVPRALRSRHLSLRQKLGMMHLLAWRELFPWIALQMFPIIAFWAVTRGFEDIDWLVPVFVMTTLFTLGTGPGQAIFIRRCGLPEVVARPRWVAWYALVAFVFYTEYKNLIARIAQVKELMGERSWKVTPRPAAAPRQS